MIPPVNNFAYTDLSLLWGEGGERGVREIHSALPHATAQPNTKANFQLYARR